MYRDNDFILSLLTGAFVFQIYRLFLVGFMAVWMRSKIGAILMITVGPPLLLTMVSWEEEVRYQVLCSMKPEQEACVEWKKATRINL